MASPSNFTSASAIALNKGATLVTIHYNDDARLAQAKSMIAASYHIAAGRTSVSSRVDSVYGRLAGLIS